MLFTFNNLCFHRFRRFTFTLFKSSNQINDTWFIFILYGLY